MTRGGRRPANRGQQLLAASRKILGVGQRRPGATDAARPWRSFQFLDPRLDGGRFDLKAARAAASGWMPVRTAAAAAAGRRTGRRSAAIRRQGPERERPIRGSGSAASFSAKSRFVSLESKRTSRPRTFQEAKESVVVFRGDRVELVIVAAPGATVRPRNVLVITSMRLSKRSAWSWRMSTGEWTSSPRNQKPVPRIDSLKPSRRMQRGYRAAGRRRCARSTNWLYGTSALRRG